MNGAARLPGPPGLTVAGDLGHVCLCGVGTVSSGRDLNVDVAHEHGLIPTAQCIIAQRWKLVKWTLSRDLPWDRGPALPLHFEVGHSDH